jgi:hypothetical protein
VLRLASASTRETECCWTPTASSISLSFREYFDVWIELGLTSVLCKNLYQENVSLKSKHDALLARIPTQTGQDISPLPSPTRVLSPLPMTSTPQYYNASRPSSPSGTLSPSLAPSSPSPTGFSEYSRRGHARRISVTPSDLSYLADQNTELLQKLEKLEEESTQADLQGKRKLRKLEKEIGLLKEELEKTRERGVELEERVLKKVARQSGVDEQVEEQKRKEREERVKALRGKGADEDAEGDKPVTDFAPAPELPRVSAFKLSVPEAIPEEQETSELPSSVSTNLVPASSSGTLSSLTTSSSTALPAPLAQCLPTSASQGHPLDYAIIAQLLSKINELEETNAQIFAEQKATSACLAKAQREVDSIRRAYDCLGDNDGEVEVWVVPDEDDEQSRQELYREAGGEDAASTFGSPLQSDRVSTSQIVRFKSLRRSIEGDISRLSIQEDPKEDFAKGVLRQSTTRSTFAFDLDEGSLRGQGKDQNQKVGGQKTRKTVVGLFDRPEEGTSRDTAAEVRRYPANVHLPPSFRPLSPICIRPAGESGDLADVSGWSNTATDNDLSYSFDSASSPDNSVYASPLPPLELLLQESPSPSPSPSQAHFRSLSPSPSTLNAGGVALHTLGSELGSEFGDDWGERAGNHHLRATSLYDISADVSMASTGSVPGGWILDGNEDDALVEPNHPPKLVIDVESDDDHLRARSGASTVIARSVSGGSASGSATPSGTVAGTPTKPRFSFDGEHNPHVVVQPPTPSPNKYGLGGAGRGPKRVRSRGSLRLASSKSVPGDGSGAGLESILEKKAEKASTRNARLSQTVRDRTSRWVERRYAEYSYAPVAPSLSPVHSPTLSAVPFPSSQDDILEPASASNSPRRWRSTLHNRHAATGTKRRRRASTAMEKMDQSFEEAAHRVSRSISLSASGPRSSVDLAKFRQMELNFAHSDVESEHDSPQLLQAFGAAPADEAQVAKKSHTGFVGFVLEVWLWLQFAIVVLVFLWAMARRGPKSVLEDAERSHRRSQRG